MGYKARLLLLLLVLAVIGELEGGRSGGGSRSRGGSTHTSSGSRSRTGGGRFGGLFGGSKSSPSSSPSHGTSSGSHTQTHTTSHTSGAGKPPVQSNRDATSTFLHAEGGGAPRPGSAGGMQPSAPPASSFGHGFPTNTGSYGTPSNGSPPRAGFSPSAPPAEHFPKSSVPLQNHGMPNTGSATGPIVPGLANPSWGNPHMGSSHPVIPPRHTSHGSSSSTTHVGFNRTLTHGGSAPYPNTHANPPYPMSHGNPPYPTSHGNPPYPTSQGNPAYPMSHGNPPYPMSHGNPPYPIPHSNTPFQTHASNPSHPPPYNTPIGGQSFPHSSYPHSGQSSFPGPYQQSSHVPLGNPYASHPVGGVHPGPGQTFYPQQPQMLAQPAAQPFIPGQTVIMMPGQQDSGRGIGQIFKEALVFSAVNAGVNRLINGAPHHHYVSESKPDSGNGGPTQVTYNNYYNSPGGGAATGGPPEGGFPSGSPVNQPSGAYVPPVIGAAGNANVPNGGTTGSVGGGSVPVVSGSGVGVQGGSGGPTVMGAAAGINQQNNQGNANNNASNNANNNAATYAAPQYRVSDDELYNITEELFSKQTLNVSKYITLNLQNRSTSANVTDQAKEPLLFVQPELLDYPTIYVTRALFDNYEHESHKKENRTMEKRMEENLLIDTFLNTNIMSRAMKWLADKGFIDPDDFERKDILRHIWFNHFSGTTCGFERVFASEKYGDTAILGVQDWLYFDYEESRKRIDYMGYTEKINLGNSSSLLKLNFQMAGIVRPNTTIFVGTLPELEMSLYTICFYARPNNLCPVSLGGTRFNLFTHSFRYFGNDLIDLGIIVI